jgi:hypothetical protein
MTDGELNAVKETGMLRGGREGTTYLTDAKFISANTAKSRLALPTAPEYRMEFRITNSPKVQGGNTVKSAYGEIGGGREYFTDDIVNIKIINYQKLK